MGCVCGFWGYFSFDLAFVFVFVSFSTIDKVVPGSGGATGDLGDSSPPFSKVGKNCQ